MIHSTISIYSPAICEYYFHLKFVLRGFEKWGRVDERTDVRKDDVVVNNGYWMWLWIGRVDQHRRRHQCSYQTVKSSTIYTYLLLEFGKRTRTDILTRNCLTERTCVNHRLIMWSYVITTSHVWGSTYYINLFNAIWCPSTSVDSVTLCRRDDVIMLPLWMSRLPDFQREFGHRGMRFDRPFDEVAVGFVTRRNAIKLRESRQA